MKISPAGFQLKLVLSYILVILLSFGFVAYFLDKNLEGQALREIKSSLLKQASLIENQLSPENLRREDAASLTSFCKTLSSKTDCRITIIASSGKVLADSERAAGEAAVMENHADRPEVKEAMRGTTGEAIRYSSTLNMDMLYIAVPIGSEGAMRGALRLALPLKSVQEILSATRRSVLLSLLFALALAFTAASILAKAILKPMRRIIYASRKFAAGDFTHTIYIDSADEMGELAVTLNTMARGLQDNIREIRLQNQQLSAILEGMVEAIVAVDKDSRIVSANPAIERVFGVKRREAEGRIFLEVIRNHDLAEVISAVFETSAFLSRELVLAWPVQRTCRVNASPIFEKESVTGCLLVIHDITEIRRLETMRQDFVANVSHELKTPLTSIKGFVETLLDGALEDAAHARQFLEVIRDHANRLDALVDDLLSLSCLESKAAVLQKEEIALRALTDEILAGFGSHLRNRSVEARNELPVGLRVGADKDKLGQVLTNLIDNAIKFNKENGSIRIYAEEREGRPTLIVEDTGIGIPRKDIPRIFERFYRVDKARSRELGGTGLGLSIVKHIIELHGGSVGVESIEGIGTKFFFTLP